MNRDATAPSPSQLEETYWWYRARQEIICDTVQRFVRRESHILDFGAGSGLIAKRLVDLGYHVVAADVSAGALMDARRRGLSTIDVSNDWPAAQSADCILACDVLEHLQDDVGTLQRLRACLRSSGWLVAAVPAYNFLWSGEDYISNHVRRYTRSSLEKCVRAAGYDIVWSSYFNTLLLPVVVGAVLYKRIFRPRDMYVSDVQPLPASLNELLYKIFLAERNILPRFRLPAGASILLVARVSNAPA